MTVCEPPFRCPLRLYLTQAAFFPSSLVPSSYEVRVTQHIADMILKTHCGVPGCLCLLGVCLSLRS